MTHKSCTHKSYKMTCDEYDALHARQGGACGVCSQTGIRLVIDHDHAFGRAGVRGLVCSYCNTGPLKMTDAGFWPETERVRAYRAAAWHLEHRVGLKPVPDGQTPVRTIRIGETWDEARVTAGDQGETISTFIRRALIAYNADPNATNAALANIRGNARESA